MQTSFFSFKKFFAVTAVWIVVALMGALGTMTWLVGGALAVVAYALHAAFQWPFWLVYIFGATGWVMGLWLEVFEARPTMKGK